MPSLSFRKPGGRTGPRACLEPALIAQRAPRRRLCHVRFPDNENGTSLSQPTEKLMSLSAVKVTFEIWNRRNHARARFYLFLADNVTSDSRATYRTGKRRHTRRIIVGNLTLRPIYRLRRRDKRSSLFLSPLSSCVRLFAP